MNELSYAASSTYNPHPFTKPIQPFYNELQNVSALI